RDRNRDGDDHRRRAVAQESEQDDDGQHAAPDRGVADRVDRALNEDALVLDDLELDVVADLVDAPHLLADPACDLDRVRAGLLANAHADRRRAVELDVAADVLVAELDACDVADPDRITVDDGDDRVRDLLDIRVLAERADVEVAQAFADVAARRVD